MSKQQNSDTLRQQAEEQWHKEHSSQAAEPTAADEMQQLLHELQVHQIELEMQNEELRQTQEELEEARAGYADLYDLAPVGYFTLDREFRILESNLQGAEMLGMERLHLIGRLLSGFVSPDSQDHYYRHCRLCAGSDKKRRTTELKLLRSDGTGLSVRLEGNQIEEAGDTGNLAYRVVLIDISERVKAEQKAIQSKEEWVKTFNGLTEIITVQDTSFQIVKSNEACCQAFHLSQDELVGRHCYELFRKSDEPCPECPILETTHHLYSCSREMMHESLGKNFLVSAYPIFNDQGVIEKIIHVARDITHQKQLEEELFQARKLEAIGTLASGIAHDFNNILSAIIGFSELAMMELTPGSNPYENINQIHNSGMRAAELVGQILTFSRRLDHRQESLNPIPYIKEALKMLRATLPSSIEIQEELDPDCDRIMADPTSIHQVMMNLCTNAAQAMADEKGILSVRLYQHSLNDADVAGNPEVSAGEFVVLEVQDTGQGMDQATRKQIFEPYFTTKEQGKGSGLGLAVTHGIVMDHRGLIKVTSRPGEGSLFSVFLPCLQDELESGDGKKQKSKEDEAVRGGTERILVVDDEELLVRINKRRLEDFGYKVTICTDSREALETIRSDPDGFDLLITDQTMPGLTGVELAKAAMQISPSLPIILCTGHSQVVSRDEAFAIGIKQYVPKPVIGDSLLSAVRTVLDQEAIK